MNGYAAMMLLVPEGERKLVEMAIKQIRERMR
jgi:hypothetical protein